METSTSSEQFCLYASTPQMRLLVWTGLWGEFYMPYIYQCSHLLAIHVCCVKDYVFLLQEEKPLLWQNEVFKVDKKLHYHIRRKFSRKFSERVSLITKILASCNNVNGMSFYKSVYTAKNISYCILFISSQIY